MGTERFLEVFCTSRAWCVGGEPVVWAMGVAGDARVAAEAPVDLSGARPDWGFGRVFVSKTYLIWYEAGGGSVAGEFSQKTRYGLGF